MQFLGGEFETFKTICMYMESQTLCACSLRHFSHSLTTPTYMESQTLCAQNVGNASYVCRRYQLLARKCHERAEEGMRRLFALLCLPCVVCCGNRRAQNQSHLAPNGRKQQFILFWKPLLWVLATSLNAIVYFMNPNVRKQQSRSTALMCCVVCCVCHALFAPKQQFSGSL